MRILLVENVLSNMRFLKDKLNGKYGTEFDLVHPPSVPQALQTLAEDPIDVVLLDLKSSDIRELEILTCVRSVDPVIPVIVLTRMEDETFGLEALRLGAQDYLPKDSLDGHTLARALHCAVERSHFMLAHDVLPGDTAKTRPSLPASAAQGPDHPLKNMVASFDLVNRAAFADILENERVLSFYQSWISLKEQTIVGFEGLCRGVGRDSGTLISPTTLLRYAAHHRLLGPLDRLFRRKVMEGFQKAARLNPHLILSVNFATPTLDDNNSAGDDFLDLAQEYGLDPGHIAIEILESHTHAPGRLKRFIQKQRERGFLIALDDIGSGYSGLNRISELEPNLIKIDRSLVAGIQEKYHQQEVFKSVIKLAHGIGAQTVAEGVETEEELMVALQLGTDIVQGYYFSMPGEIQEDILGDCEGKIHEAKKKFRSYISKQINDKRCNYGKLDEMIRRMITQMSQATPKHYDSTLQGLLQDHQDAECLFVLDEGGAQLSVMVSRVASPQPHSGFLRPFKRGTNHSAMDYYYYHVENGFQRTTFVTEPFLTPGRATRCVTVSTLFKNAYGHTSILCADIHFA